MSVSLHGIEVGTFWSRKALAERWGYKGYQALARGVVTPAGDNKIILFVTRLKQPTAVNYRDDLVKETLYWQGPTDHFGEERLLASRTNNDEVHLFFRQKHHTNFEYCGRVNLTSFELSAVHSSSFVFQVQARLTP